MKQFFVSSASLTKHLQYVFTFDLLACDCSVDGTVSDICNNMTSNCLCKESNTGTQCSECNSSYYRNINSNTTECQGIFSSAHVTKVTQICLYSM